MTRTKITYIISNIEKALAFEWVASYLDKTKFELSFILLNPSSDSPLQDFVSNLGLKVLHIPYHGKKDVWEALKQTRTFLKNEKTDIIHTHLFEANIVGLLAGKLIGIKKRIHTRHHSSLHHTYFPRAVYYDKFINWLSTDIIAITDKVNEILIDWEKVSPEKTQIIHHGFDLDLFQKPNQNKIQEVKERHNIPTTGLVFGVIARYTYWKGIQYIIPAFKEIQKKNPTAHLVLANASGDYLQEIKALLAELPKDSYTEITFEKEIASLYRTFDFYIHTPIDNHSEAFGQTYIEALASNIPSIFSLSGIANSFIQHKKNALVVKHQSVDDIIDKMQLLISDNNLCSIITEGGQKSCKDFALEPFIKKLETLYLS